MPVSGFGTERRARETVVRRKISEKEEGGDGATRTYAECRKGMLPLHQNRSRGHGW
jgi:hypothetical protein